MASGFHSIKAALADTADASSFTISGTIDEAVNLYGTSIGVDDNGNAWVAYKDGDASAVIAKQSANWTDAWTAYDSGDAVGSSSATAMPGPDIVPHETDIYILFIDSSNDLLYDKYTGSWAGTTLLEDASVAGLTFTNPHTKHGFYVNNDSSGVNRGNSDQLDTLDYVFQDTEAGDRDVWWNTLDVSGGGGGPETAVKDVISSGIVPFSR
jgi:hypothetical protein